jgi:hypothetical protein
MPSSSSKGVLGGVTAFISREKRRAERRAKEAAVFSWASWGRAGRFQQGAVIGTVIFLVITGVFVFNGMVFVARHDTSSWISGMITVLLRHGGLSFLLAGWAFFSLRHKEGV